jgi:hypothetical protein
MLLPFFFPRYIDSAIAGPEGAKNLAGKNVLRLIQIRLTTSSVEKITPACQANSPQAPNRRFKFHKRRQLFVGVDNETLSAVPMCVCNKDCRPATIHGSNPNPNSNRHS